MKAQGARQTTAVVQKTPGAGRQGEGGVDERD